ncbi:hypothetical protein RvY_18115 [Ramazzottius varieornatus]|uniref:Uncharacterized protein n=1 Tax=Ramazzottius varieornatus TaxID=947166 RepID=A0A1D1W9X2_RAMVA|nr:hypothetical protein RvY_18115 [Ramazzottius varieornatus]
MVSFSITSNVLEVWMLGIGSQLHPWVRSRVDTRHGNSASTRTSTRRARRITLPSVQPGSEGEPKSAKKTLATDSKDPTTHMDQLEHQTGNDGASRTWKWTSENLDEGGKNAPSFLVW